MKRIYIALAIATSVAHADEQVVVLSTERLPGCIETVQYKKIYPRWKVRNTCPFPVEILWCWKPLPNAKDLVNQNNTCPNTGFVSSGLVDSHAEFEFSDRPYINNEFKASAMLDVKKVCKVSKAGQCN